MIGESALVRQMVSNIKNNLEAEREQINSVALLKSLHDRLHELQAHDFREIQREQELLPAIARAWPNLTNLADWVKSRAEVLRSIATMVYPEEEAMEWVDELVSAAEQLHQGALHRDENEVEDGVLGLSRVLSTRPAQVNTDLLKAIRGMKLRVLFGELMRIGEEMARAEVAENDVRTFTTGGRDLGRFDREITDLMEQHDRWQEIDVEASRIDNNWKGHPRELNASWPRLSTMVREQLEFVTAPHDKDLDAAIEAVAGVLDETGPGSTENKYDAFRKLRKHAVDWFHTLDTILLGRCNELKAIDAALSLTIAAVGKATSQGNSGP